MSRVGRTVAAMTKQMPQTREHDVLAEACPRCGSASVRVVDEYALADDAPLFDCRECGFEWGELLGDLMR